jgi:hypothetical protein
MSAKIEHVNSKFLSVSATSKNCDMSSENPAHGLI